MKPYELRKKGRILEENVELENVTKLRQNLLPIIERLEDDPALRFLILKHGKPQAVLMSVETYELMKKLLNQFQQQMAALTREERIQSAEDELRSERGNARLPVTELCDVKRPAAQQLDVVLNMLQQLRQDLRQSEAAKSEFSK